MEIITVLLSTGEDGAPLVQVISSDGVDPEDGARACRRAMDAFKAKAMEAEIQRRVEAVQNEADQKTKPAEDDE